MDTAQLIKILTELVDKSSSYEDGFLAPQRCKIKISELNSYDSKTFEYLETIKRSIWSEEMSNQNTVRAPQVSLLELEDDSVTFFPTVIRQYLKNLSR